MMTITVNNKTMNEVLNNMYRVINSNNSLPILGDFLFAVKDGKLNVKASDSDTTISADIELTEAEGEGAFAVNARNIVDGIKNIITESITITKEDDKNIVKVDYFTGYFTLPVDDATEFPAIPVVSEDNRTFAISEKVLMDNISRTVFATANDTLRPVMNGIFFGLTTEQLTVAASDGHQLVKNDINDIRAEDDSKAGSFILPKKAALLLKNNLSNSDEVTTVVFDDRQATITTQHFTMTTRLIEGRYPNINSVIPQNNSNIAIVDRKTLVAALKRVTPFSNDSSQLVRIHLENNIIQLDTEDYDFSKSATEQVACSYDGNAMNIGMKGSSVMNILSNIDSKEIELRLSDPSRAALIVPVEQPENTDILMLQMPMLIND